MSNNHYKEVGCRDEELFVSYLYDEIDDSDKSRLEKHLRDCASCAEELAALRGVQFSVAEWKRTELPALSVPLVQLPVAARKTIDLGEVAAVRTTLRERMRALFALPSAGFAAAGLAFVLLLTAATVFLVLSKTGSQTEIAGDNTGQPIAAPTGSETRTAVIKTESTPAASLPARSADEPAPATDAAAPPKPNNDARRKTPPPTEKVKAATTTPTRKNSPANGKKKETRAPALTPFEDEEDETLRLADLFAEIETDE